MWVCEVLNEDVNFKPFKKYIIGPKVSIGRKKDCDIAFSEDKSVSRNHAELIMTSDGLFVNDLGSKFCTHVISGSADRELETSKWYHLKNGDIIKIGACSSRVKVWMRNFLFCPTKLDKTEKDFIKASIGSLDSAVTDRLRNCDDFDMNKEQGGDHGFSSDGVEVVSYVVANKFAATVKILQAIIHNITIVNTNWVRDMVRIATSIETTDQYSGVNAKSNRSGLIDMLTDTNYFPSIQGSVSMNPTNNSGNISVVVNSHCTRFNLLQKYVIYLSNPTVDEQYRAVLEHCGSLVSQDLVPILKALTSEDQATTTELKLVQQSSITMKLNQLNGQNPNRNSKVRTEDDIQTFIFVDDSMSKSKDPAKRQQYEALMGGISKLQQQLPIPILTVGTMAACVINYTVPTTSIPCSRTPLEPGDVTDSQQVHNTPSILMGTQLQSSQHLPLPLPPGTSNSSVVANNLESYRPVLPKYDITQSQYYMASQVHIAEEERLVDNHNRNGIHSNSKRYTEGVKNQQCQQHQQQDKQDKQDQDQQQERQQDVSESTNKPFVEDSMFTDITSTGMVGSGSNQHAMSPTNTKTNAKKPGIQNHCNDIMDKQTDNTETKETKLKHLEDKGMLLNETNSDARDTNDINRRTIAHDKRKSTLIDTCIHNDDDDVVVNPVTSADQSINSDNLKRKKGNYGIKDDDEDRNTTATTPKSNEDTNSTSISADHKKAKKRKLVDNEGYLSLKGKEKEKGGKKHTGKVVGVDSTPDNNNNDNNNDNNKNVDTVYPIIWIVVCPYILRYLMNHLHQWLLKL